MKKRSMIILLILLLTIGFAAVSTTLIINGAVNFGVDVDDFEVIFTEALLDGSETSKATIGSDKKTITFNTDKLTRVGDTTELVYKVKNNSTQYGASVTMDCTIDPSEHVTVTSTFDGKAIPLVTPVEMEAQEVKLGKITAVLTKSYTGVDSSIGITCTIVANATEENTIIDYTPNRYREDILNGADPILAKGLVPVTIENDGTVKKADINTEWYDYETKRWANAVILENNNYSLIEDSSGNGNLAVAYNVTENDGYVTFKGDNTSKIISNKSYTLKQDSNYSIIIKFKYKSNDGVRSMLFGGPLGVYFNENTGNLIVSIATEDSNGNVIYQWATVASSHFTDGEIYNLVITFDGSYMRVYDNGSEIARSSLINNVHEYSLNYIIGNSFNSDIYYLALSNSCLNSSEIQEYYNKGSLEKSKLDSEYKFSKIKKVDMSIIPEVNIQSYFVWIPRYRYQIFDEGNYTSVINEKPTESISKEIQIVFENKNTTPANGSTKDTWLTHPAFTNFDVNGLWVGKFETGYRGADSTADAEVNANDSSKVVIKPNVYSWRGSTVGNIFKTAYNYKRPLDSHMMKNTEWGAVAYLSHSKYGINKEVNINNNSAYLTGYSATAETDQSDYPGEEGTYSTVTLAYNTPTGYLASTTGNITGVYDMSGGSHEYMAAYVDGYGAKSSGFIESELTTYSKYLDKYSSTSTINSYNNRILGDATGEMGPFYNYADKDNVKRPHNNWYGDVPRFIDSYHPWFYRGGAYEGGIISGQFRFCKNTGASNIAVSSRLVLAP